MELLDTPATLLAGIFLFLAFDSLIAFKSILLYCFG